MRLFCSSRRMASGTGLATAGVGTGRALAPDSRCENKEELEERETRETTSSATSSASAGPPAFLPWLRLCWVPPTPREAPRSWSERAAPAPWEEWTARKGPSGWTAATPRDASTATTRRRPRWTPSTARTDRPLRVAGGTQGGGKVDEGRTEPHKHRILCRGVTSTCSKMSSPRAFFIRWGCGTVNS